MESKKKSNGILQFEIPLSMQAKHFFFFLFQVEVGGLPVFDVNDSL